MAKLRYISTDAVGYVRKKWGKGFTYRDQHGETIRDPELRQWIEGLKIPPAWTDVWISPHKNGHILATGRDNKGRKQYIYHPDWREEREQQKFNELYQFGQCLTELREVTDAHLRKHSISRDRVLAAIVQLLERTLIRIGNSEYAQKNDSYGLTTLTDDHAYIEGSKIVFEFTGKSNKEHTIMLKDHRLANIVKHCQDIPGYELFQYYDENGDHQTVDSADVNAYLCEITGQPFTAKVFRTWGGSTLAIKYLCENCEAATDEDARACVNYVAEHLGNTGAISEKYYIYPGILEAFFDGRLQEIYDKYNTNSDDDTLYPEEKTLMKLIEQNAGPDNERKL